MRGLKSFIQGLSFKEKIISKLLEMKLTWRLKINGDKEREAVPIEVTEKELIRNISVLEI